MIEHGDKFIWRTERRCDNCPFASKGAGLHLRRTLGSGRWRGILHSLRNSNHFLCHKTTDQTGNGTNLVCAGSIEWQEKHKVHSTLSRMAEFIIATRKTK